jgi:hypothetical protein
MTINERLDELFPAVCLACDTPYKRTEAKWIKGRMVNQCVACGLDQTSAEAGAIRRFKDPCENGENWPK